MKGIFKKFFLFALLAVAVLPFTANKEVMAEGEVVYYVFTGHEIPAGQSEIFIVDPGAFDLFRQNPAIINIYVSALAEKYDTPSQKLDQNAEVAYLSGVAAGTMPAGQHLPVFLTAAVPPVFQPSPESVTAPVTESVAAPVPELKLPGVGGVLPSPVNMDINAGNYIDINITTQTLTLFQNGVGTYAVPVVTGNVRAGHSTPQGLFSVQYKQLDRTLKGEDYESFVHYWMRIVNNVGIHDANWRGSFGGEIYRKNGSHGCINVPPSLMPALYAATPEGLPVWVHS